MKILLISGSHPRHFFVHEEIINLGYDCSAIVMNRENLIPDPPANISFSDKNLFEKHFNERYKIENTAFGKLSINIFNKVETLFCNPHELNSQRTAEFIRKQNPNIAFIFGPDLIKNPVFRELPKDKINLHLGLSPWYRGSATLFWPFYFLEPQFAGATFHQISLEADAGGILHQSIPILEYNDGIHDVAVKTVLSAKNDLRDLLGIFKQKKKFFYKKQKSTGKLFLTKDFKPHHLKNIYQFFNNDIVKHYLKGNLGTEKPKLIRAF
tara:strand:- start:1564 stop:2364 length:801 start_codon:yes stop_codon:yes gene_type:complete